MKPTFSKICGWILLVISIVFILYTSKVVGDGGKILTSDVPKDVIPLQTLIVCVGFLMVHISGWGLLVFDKINKINKKE